MEDKKQSSKQTKSSSIARRMDDKKQSAKQTKLSILDQPDERREEVWLDSQWELTWPIWHMLPRHEKKDLALQSGYKTIGEFEEFMSLKRGITDSETTAFNSVQKPYQNELIYATRAGDINSQGEPVAAPTSTTTIPESHENDAVVDEDNQSSCSDEEPELEDVKIEELSTEELIALGGQILMLPEELLHKIFDWLPVDAYAMLARVSPHWRCFTRTETVYKRLCERLYLNQSKRRALHVSRFGGSYRNMLLRRPRVRAGGGVYVMKYSKVKPIQRDLWTEIPMGAVLEMVYYRYLYFQEDGRCLYALTSAAPHEMFRRFLRILLNRDYQDQSTVWGTYQVQRNHVTVEAKQPWQYVRLEMTIQPHQLYHGRWGYLSFNRHMTSTSNNFADWSDDRVVYEVPEEPFRFVRDKRL